MQFMDLKLARRVEMAEAFAARACAETVNRLRPELAVAIERIGGGVAAFTGIGSPVTQAIGVGLDGPTTEAELDRLEEFFWSRGARTELELCPLVDLSLYEQFAKRGYVLIEVSNVLIREISPADVFSPSAPAPGVTLREAERGEANLWTQTVAQGFAEHFPVTREILDVMEGFFHREGAAFLLAFVDGKVAGGAVVSAHEGVGGLFGASTLVEFRRRGVQSALLAARLAWARDRGCDVAVSITQPGSASQRNIERYGFRVAYTRTKLARAKP
ncbi:MAG TPA: GNAT family N-acetyltransferase [Candidatus Angelobacter sp.]|jgi:GNAT superfamily N-acetyltransferase|nr:GNAT family N-acetyltransferase [Candidatus Angelobacter sp.]